MEARGHELLPADFVYTGLRLDEKGKRRISIRVLNADGTLTGELWLEYSRKADRTVGAVYRGARFAEGQAAGIDGAVFVERWNDEAQCIEWAARHQSVEARMRLKSLEADSGRVGELETALRPARKTYDSMRRRYDTAGMAALEQAVLAALRAPLRKSEQ